MSNEGRNHHKFHFTKLGAQVLTFHIQYPTLKESSVQLNIVTLSFDNLPNNAAKMLGNLIVLKNKLPTMY